MASKRSPIVINMNGDWWAGFGLFALICCCSALLALAAVTNNTVQRSAGPDLVVRTFLFVVGCALPVHLGRCVVVLLSLRRMRSSEELCRALRIDPKAMAETGKRLRPRFIVNGKPLYDPSQFGEAMSLVRGSSAPSGGLLLSAAAGEVHAQMLLRSGPESRQ